MTSPKPDRAQKPGRAAGGRPQQGFGAVTVAALCAACFFAGRFLTLPGQLPPAVGKGVSDHWGDQMGGPPPLPPPTAACRAWPCSLNSISILVPA